MNGSEVIAILGTGTNPVGPLAGHVLRGESALSPDVPGYVDQIGHDTLTASVALAWDPDALIDPIVVVGPDGDATPDLIAAGVGLALADGADVISISFASLPTAITNPLMAFDRSSMFAAFARAGLAGVPVVLAAGNAANNNDLHPVWPSNDASELPTVVSVAAVDSAGNLGMWANSEGSNYGARTVTLAAPGSGVPATDWLGNPGLAYGTSMAAPEIAAVLARIRAVRPNERAASLVTDLRSYVTPTAGTVGTTRYGGAILSPPSEVVGTVSGGGVTVTVPVPVAHPHHHPVVHHPARWRAFLRRLARRAAHTHGHGVPA